MRGRRCAQWGIGTLEQAVEGLNALDDLDDDGVLDGVVELIEGITGGAGDALQVAKEKQPLDFIL